MSRFRNTNLSFSSLERVRVTIDQVGYLDGNVILEIRPSHVSSGVGSVLKISRAWVGKLLVIGWL